MARDDRDLIPAEDNDLVEEEREEVLQAERVDPDRGLTVGEIVDGVNDAIDDIGTSARRLIDRGRYRKVRISRKGKQLLPDIPLAAVAAVEAATMAGAGIARVLAVNVGAKFLFDVEIVNEADKYVERGKAALLDGDLDRAEEALVRAVRIDDTHAGGFLQLGVLYRLKGERDAAEKSLLRAKALDPTGDIGRRAEEILRALER